MPKRPDKYIISTAHDVWHSSFSNKAKHEKDKFALISMNEDRSYRHNWTNPRTQSRHHRHHTNTFDNTFATSTYFNNKRSAKRNLKNKGLELDYNYPWLNEE